MSSVESFPLSWPVGFPRTKFPKRAIYKATTGRARDQVLHELKLMGIPDWNVIISSNVPVSSRTMQMLSLKAEPSDPGIAVYFRVRGIQRVLACDKWDKIADNLRAIAMTIEAMRGLDRWGCSEMLDRVFQGFNALPPPPAAAAPRTWWEVLGVARLAYLDVIETQYRFLARKRHPDAGGSNEAMSELNRAIEEARAEKSS